MGDARCIPPRILLDCSPETEICQAQGDANHAGLATLHSEHCLLLQQRLLIALQLRRAREVAVRGQAQERATA